LSGKQEPVVVTHTLPTDSSMANATVDTQSMQWDDPQIPIAIGISIGAGLATGVGGSLVFAPELLRRVPQAMILAVSLALSAGVMIYVSFIEIFAKSFDAISEQEGMTEGGAAAITTICFFAGMCFCALLEVVVHKCLPPVPHHLPAESTTTSSGESKDGDKQLAPETSVPSVSIDIVDESKRDCAAKADAAAAAMPGDLLGNKSEAPQLARMGMMTALAIAIHNFPEGLATFLATLQDTGLGASLGIAISVHNIPEGLCVAMPIYYATGSKRKAFMWSLLSGVTEPLGGILGFAILQPVFTPLVFGIVFSMVGGMMVFIVCHELLPAAHKYMGNGSKTTMWLIIGMVIMATSLVLFVL